MLQYMNEKEICLEDVRSHEWKVLHIHSISFRYEIPFGANRQEH